jgi:phenylalanyl-tRNA synthetase alpha chain
VGLTNKIKNYSKEIEGYVVKSKEELEQYRITFLGSKNKIKLLFNEFKSLGAEEKKALGKDLNTLKQLAEKKFKSLEVNHSSKKEGKRQSFDLTKPSGISNVGSRHPISIVRSDIEDIFARIGFNISEGPEIEDDWHNFSALNFPEDHPARDMQDTFFIDNEYALRTHTSSVQIRVMEQSNPPIRTISPGRVFRNEAISARAHCIFHQVEGLYIDKDVSFADLKQVLYYFAKEMFGQNVSVRFRPSYFPFTEPSAEMDVSCNICNGTGCNICKYTGFVEILGCGMVDPNVLENCNIDPETYSGYAFGMGIERMTMLKYGINDLRLFFENDVRFLNQFSKES